MLSRLLYFILFFVLKHSFAIPLLNETELSLTGDVGDTTLYTYSIIDDSHSTFIVSVEGMTYYDRSSISATYSCDSSCTSGNLNPYSYCKSYSYNEVKNTLTFYSKTICDIEIKVTINAKGSSFLVRTRHYPIIKLPDFYSFTDFLNPAHSVSRYFSLPISENSIPATLSLVLKPAASLDNVNMFISGDCLCGNDKDVDLFFKKNCNSGTYFNILVEKNCTVYVHIDIYSYDSGFTLTSSFDPIISLQNNQEINVNAKFSRSFTYQLDDLNVPASIYFIIKNSSSTIYATNDCGCNYKAKNPNDQQYCYSSSSSVLATYMGIGCNVFYTVSSGGIYTVKVIMNPIMVIEENIALDFGPLDSDIRVKDIFFFFVHRTKGSSSYSTYIAIEGETDSDLSYLYVNNQDPAKCVYNSFPGYSASCISGQRQGTENNFVQINSEVPQNISIGVKVFALFKKFTLRITKLLTTSLLNNTNVFLSPISSIKLFSMKYFLTYQIPKDVIVSAIYIYVRGKTTSDRGSIRLNYDCVSACPYRSFPGDNPACYASSTSGQIFVVDQYLTTSCFLHIGLIPESYNEGFDLLLINLPKSYLKNQQLVLFNHFSLPVVLKNIYVAYYFEILPQFGTGIIRFSYIGQTLNDYADLIYSGAYFCNPSSEYPIARTYYYQDYTYCGYASHIGKITTLDIPIKEPINTKITISMNILNYYQGGTFSVKMDQDCLTSSSNFCSECEINSLNKPVCIMCQSQYLLDESHLCQPCDKFDGYFFDEKLQKCNQCIENCKTCTNLNVCSVCLTGYDYDIKLNQCICSVSKIPYCTKCSYDKQSSNATCLDCIEGYGLNSNGICYNLSTDPNFYIQQQIFNEKTKLKIAWTNVNPSEDVFQYVFFSLQSNIWYQNSIIVNPTCNNRFPKESTITFLSNKTSVWVELEMADFIKCGFSSSDNTTWEGSIIYYNVNNNKGYATLLKLHYQPNNYGELVLREDSDTFDGTSVIFSSEQDPNLKKEIVSYGEKLQLTILDSSQYDYAISIQDSDTFKSQYIIKNKCNTKFAGKSYVPFDESVSGSTKNVTTWLSLTDLMNCGFKRVNNGDTYTGVIIIYNTDIYVAYLNVLTIVVQQTNDGRNMLTVKNENNSIVIISNMTIEKTLSVDARLSLYTDSNYATKKKEILSNDSVNYFLLTLEQSVNAYSLNITKGFLESDNDKYLLDYLKYMEIHKEANSVQFTLDFSKVKIGTYELKVYFDASLESKKRFRTLAVSSENSTVTNSSSFFINVKGKDIGIQLFSWIIKEINIFIVICLFLIS